VCDCDCELTKHKRWALVKEAHGQVLARKLRWRARQMARLRSEEARLTAAGLRIGADMIEQEMSGDV
jgi:hypothetical protein